MVEYKEFRVGELFDVKSTKKTIHKNMIDPSDWGGQHPYITRTTQNNGLSGYIDYDEDFLNDANTISLGLDTYTLSYQPDPYFTGNKVKVLHLKDCVLNSRVAMYLISVYNRMFEGYDWGTGINQQAIVNMALTLPVTPTGQPDFDFMENYIKEIEQKRIEKLESDLDSRTENLLTVIGHEDLIGDPDGLAEIVAAGFDDSGVNYEEFPIKDMFTISRGDIKNRKSVIELDSERDGSVSFIAQNNSDNGYVSLVDPEDLKIFPANSIMIGRQTGVVYYQKDSFVTTDGVLVLEPTFDMDANVGLYITTAMSKLLQSFGYDNTVSTTKLNSMVLTLPTTASGTPDLDFMAQYIAHIELKHTHSLMQWISAKESI